VGLVGGCEAKSGEWWGSEVFLGGEAAWYWIEGEEGSTVSRALIHT
jgi:hypothetical protein